MTDDQKLAKKIVDSIITMPRWRFLGSVLVAFLVPPGFGLGPPFFQR